MTIHIEEVERQILALDEEKTGLIRSYAESQSGASNETVRQLQSLRNSEAELCKVAVEARIAEPREAIAAIGIATQIITRSDQDDQRQAFAVALLRRVQKFLANLVGV